MLLPRMTWGNWLFWGILAFVGVNFFWIGVLETFIPLWVGTIVGFIIFIVLVFYGPREKEEEEQNG